MSDRNSQTTIPPLTSLTNWSVGKDTAASPMMVKMELASADEARAWALYLLDVKERANAES